MASPDSEADSPPKGEDEKGKGDSKKGEGDSKKGEGDSKKGDDETDWKNGDKKDAGDDAKEDGDKEDGEKKGGDDGDKEKEDKKPSPLKKTWVRVVIGIAVILLLVVASVWFYRYWTHGRFVVSTNNAYIEADQIVVTSKVDGTVEAVYVSDNEEVAIGQPLVKLDSKTNSSKLEQAMAQARQGRANMRQYQSQIKEQEAVVERSLAQAEGGLSRYRYARGEANRYAPLADSGAETQEKSVEMTFNADQAAATLVQNEASVAEARRKITTLRAQVDLYAAQVEQADAQAHQAQIDIDSSLLRATAVGRVGDRQVRVGQYAPPGTRLLTVVPIESLYLVANFKETQIGLMRIGQPASITVDALSGETLSGTVDSFSPGTGAKFALIPANNATGNFTKIVQRVPVKIRFEAGTEARRVLVAGLSVTVSVDTLGSKQDKEFVKDEGKAGKDERERATKEAVQRDRNTVPSNGPGSPASEVGR